MCASGAARGLPRPQACSSPSPHSRLGFRSPCGRSSCGSPATCRSPPSRWPCCSRCGSGSRPPNSPRRSGRAWSWHCGSSRLICTTSRACGGGRKIGFARERAWLRERNWVGWEGRVKIAVVGGGAWGTALADLLARKGDFATVSLWAREPEVVESVNREHLNHMFLPGAALAPALTADGDLTAAVRGAEVVVSAAPSHAVREVMTR